MKKCNLVYTAYKEEYVFDDNNYEHIKNKVILFLKDIDDYFSDKVYIFKKFLLEKCKGKKNINNIDDICIHEILDYPKTNFEKIDMNFLAYSITLLNTYEKIVMNKKYVYYDRKSFWDKYKIISAQICMNCENDLEKHIIYIINEIIIKMFEDNSLSMSYPQYFINPLFKQKQDSFIDKYNTLLIDDLEKEYREEYGNRYDDKFTNID